MFPAIPMFAPQVSATIPVELNNLRDDSSNGAGQSGEVFVQFHTDGDMYVRDLTNYGDVLTNVGQWFLGGSGMGDVEVMLTQSGPGTYTLGIAAKLDIWFPLDSQVDYNLVKISQSLDQFTGVLTMRNKHTQVVLAQKACDWIVGGDGI